MPLQPSVPSPPAGSSASSSYLYNQPHHQLHLNSQPQQHHQLYNHQIPNNSRSSLSLSYAPGPSQPNLSEPTRPSYPQHRHSLSRDEYTSGVDVASWMRTSIPPEQGTSRAIIPLRSKAPSVPRLSVAGGITGPATHSSAVSPLSKTQIAPPQYYQHQRSDSHSSLDYSYPMAASTMGAPYAEGSDWRQAEAPTRGWNNGTKGPGGVSGSAYVFPVMDRASLTEHLPSHHHHQSVPPMMSYGLPAQSSSSSLRQSGSAAGAHQEFAGGGTPGTSHSAASPLDSSLHNNTSHDPASSAQTLDVYNTQVYAHHLPPLDEFHHPLPPPPSARYPVLRYPYALPESSGQYTIPPPHTSAPTLPDHVPVSTRASISSNSSSTMHSNSPPTYPGTPAHSQSPEHRSSSSFVYTSPSVAHNSIHNSPVVPTVLASPDVSAVLSAQRSSGSPAALPRLPEPVEELNLIPEDGTAAASASSAKEKQTIFECPGCDLTFTRLSALKQHMLSHTGEKPHATKACKVLKFQAVKENISGATAAVSTASPSALLPAAVIPTSAPLPIASSSSAGSSAAGAAIGAAAALVPSGLLSSPEAPKKEKKRKATSEKPSPRRKRHANFETRWIPRTLALFKNAHLLTSTPPFQFCMYKAKPVEDAEVVDPEDNGEPEPFTRPTVPLSPVRPSITSRASIRSVDSVESAESSGSSSSSSDDAEVPTDDGMEEEERDSFEAAPEYPYHPMSWSGKLPGPGMLGGDELVKNPSHARRWMTFKR
ncbi:hypothetical protein FRB90_002468 [Tulasnella sp. 427]|nr:hypothetical protein FRB90_002468 [Tulasnella sp. 427]